MKDGFSLAAKDLDHEDPFRRRASIEALGKLATPLGIAAQLDEDRVDDLTAQVIGAVRPKLWDEEWFVMLAALQELARLGDHRASTALYHRFRWLTCDNRREIVRELLVLIPSTDEAFRKLFPGPREATETRLERFVRMMGSANLMMPALIRALKDRDDTVCRNAIWALSKIPGLGLLALSPLIWFTKTRNGYTRERGEELRQDLLEKGADATTTLIDVTARLDRGALQDNFSQVLLMHAQRIAIELQQIVRARKSWTPCVRREATRALLVVHPLLVRAYDLLDAMDLADRRDSDRMVFWGYRAIEQAIRKGERSLKRASTDRDPRVQAVIAEHRSLANRLVEPPHA